MAVRERSALIKINRLLNPVTRTRFESFDEAAIMSKARAMVFAFFLLGNVSGMPFSIKCKIASLRVIYSCRIKFANCLKILVLKYGNKHIEEPL